MPRKKKVPENVVPEKVESAVVPEAAENKQAELKGASIDALMNVVEKGNGVVEIESTEKATPKQRKPRAKKAAAQKETVAKGKRGPAKKETTKKEAGKKDDSAQEKQIFIQYAEKEVTMAIIEERVKKAWESEGHRASSIKKLDIYIKPEESAVYYVINGKNAGRVDF